MSASQHAPWLTAIGLALSLAPSLSHAQIKTLPDGKWRQILGAGASLASGNSDLRSFNLGYDLARATDRNSFSLRAKALYNTAEGETSAHNSDLSVTGKHNLRDDFYVYANGTWFRDRIAKLSHRLSTSGGFGYKLIKTPQTDWEVFAGLGYTQDRYTIPTIVDDRLRTRYGRTELTLGNESTHQLTDTTTFHQRLALFPAMNKARDLRAEFLANLSVAMTKRLALTATAELRYNSDPGNQVSKMDRRFTTGISLKFVD
ncbi:MAG: DUF481 domain-containing protein [Lautropia sp.]|nr:DUF481 domain-containing protein [Lautropia sp.]